jgi:P-type Ca2+ transporter type 2C
MRETAMTDGPDVPPETDLSTTVYTLPTAEVFHLFATRPGGLTDSEAGKNLIRFGKNRIQKIKGKPLYLRFLANFTHLMAILLWVGGLIAFIARMPPLGVAIWMVNLINGIFSFWQEFRAEKAAEALMKLLPHHVRVIRDNKVQEILAEDIVPGDVMLLAEGDHISADARLVEEMELRLDQSTLTGESRPVRKTCEAFLQSDQSRIDIPNLVFAGTNVVSGTGRAVVYATGMETEFGRIAHLTQTLEDDPSPLQKEMIHVTRMVTLVAVGIGALFFLLLLLLSEITLAESFIFAVGMIVAFVPEGLLPTVTLALATGSQRMARRNALIKRLSAVETLGCTSVICTDKTGTLTQNEMTVSKIWVARQRFTVTGVGYAPDGVIFPEGEGVQAGSRTDMRQLLIAAGLCNNARLIAPQGDSIPWMILGDPTEAALKVAALKGGVDIEAEVQKAPRLRELPFESGRKMMSSIHQTDHSRVAYLKGAPKVILSLCTSIRRDQQDCPLTEDLINEIIAVNDEYATSGLRVLAIALRTIPDTLSDYRPDTVERDLTFLGLVAMMDPPRTEVAEAVMKCHSASIRIIMITGDYGLTAESIARRIGIITGEKTRIITGQDLDTMSDADLQEAFLSEVIFARVAPEQKLRVVTVLQEMGHVVAVTGDGVNDAPALKKADIGIAMGVAGTDVAKEAADMVLTDDNFASIVNAVEEGRAVYANIKKFTSYIFTSNTPEAVPFICFAFSWARIPLALNVMEILSIDLGTDMVPALALGTEPPELGVMKKPPRDLKEHVITTSLLIKSYLWLGSIQSLAVMMAFFLMFWTNGYWGQFLDLPSRGTLYQSATAMALAAVVTTQIGNVLAQRTEHRSIFEIGLLTNRLIVIGIVSELVLISMIVYVPFFQRVFGTAAFPPVYWLFLFALVPLLLIAEELRKGILRWMEQKKTKRTHAGDVT